MNSYIQFDKFFVTFFVLLPFNLRLIGYYYLEPNLRYDRCDTQFGIGGGLLVYVRNGLHVLPIDNKYDF